MAYINSNGQMEDDGFRCDETEKIKDGDLPPLGVFELNRTLPIGYDRDSTIDSVSIYPDGSGFEVISRRKSNIMYACFPARMAADSVWKNIFLVKDGKIVFDKTVHAAVEPAHQVGEKIIWPGNNEKKD